MDKEAWHATVHGVAESDTTERLNSNYPKTLYVLAFLSISRRLPRGRIRSTQHRLGIVRLLHIIFSYFTFYLRTLKIPKN